MHTQRHFGRFCVQTMPTANSQIGVTEKYVSTYVDTRIQLPVGTRFANLKVSVVSNTIRPMRD